MLAKLCGPLLRLCKKKDKKKKRKKASELKDQELEETKKN